MSDLAQAVADLIGEPAARVERLHGGDLSEVFRLTRADGSTLVAKRSGTAAAEGRMLGAIAATGAPAPRVLATGQGLLVMEDLGEDAGPASAWTDLGRHLRRLHAATGDSYGWDEDFAFGAAAIPNRRMESWPRFWAERRLLAWPGALPQDLARRVEALSGRLGDLLPERPAASLLHGDLWSGNVMARGGRVTGLIDPACYHGHAEVDLAMLALFGSPNDAFREAYGPAEQGLAARRPIYQLWPALVHLRLFGAGYRPLVERLLDAAG